jgi:cAMP-dependent protein kinase regulator
MASPRLRRLKDRAAQALRRGQLEKALEAYRQLERAEPRDPTWPRRRADACARLGRPDDELVALVRAAELYAAGGFAIQAIGACKRILQLDPHHTATQERLFALQVERGVSLARLPESRDFPASAEAPLDELILTEVVPDAHPAHLEWGGEAGEGVAEIPLDARPGQGELDLELTGRGSAAPAAPTAGGDPLAAAREQLRRTPLFGSLDRASLARVIEQVRLVELDEGQVLFRQGDRADALYVVVEGAVVPIAEDEAHPGHPTRLAVLEAGAFFGEIGLVTNRPRTATIQTLVPTQLLAVDRALLWSLLRERPDCFAIVLRFLRERLVDRLVRTSPLFAAFAEAERSQVAKEFRLLEVKDGAVVIQQGRPAPGLFALLCGQMQVIYMDTDGDKVLATLRPGEIWGERSLLRGDPELAGVVASGKCWLFALPEPQFQRIAARNPKLREWIAHVLEEREAENENTLRRARRLDDGDLGLI